LKKLSIEKEKERKEIKKRKEENDIKRKVKIDK